MAAVGQSVEWGGNRADFDRYVEALIVQMWADKSDIEVQAVNGRGGDGGLDVYVRRAGVLVQVYQLKFFPGGMSGGWSSRRSQVTKSFNSVADSPGLEKWTLVMPENPTVTEEAFVEGLRGERTISMEIMGQAKLDVAAALHPSILHWATRNAVIQLLGQAGHEKDALAGPRDLDHRAQELLALGATQSPYWGWRITGDGKYYEKTLYAKRADAAEKEPITISLDTRFSPEHEEVRQQFTRAMEFGTASKIELPPEVVEMFRVEGPAWIAEESAHVGVDMMPVELAEPVEAEVRTVNPDGSVAASLSGRVNLASPGSKGGTIQGRFGPLTLTFRIPLEGLSGGVDVSYDVRGVSATVANRMLRFLSGMMGGLSVEFYIARKKALKTGGQVETVGGDRTPLPDDLLALIDDLAVLERAYDVELLVDPGVSAADRLDIRVARMLTEGRATAWPRVNGLDFKLSGVRGEAFDELLTTGGAILATNPKFEMSIYGRPLTLGTLAVYHPALEIKNAEEARARLEAGTAEGLPVSLVPMDASPMRIFIRERWKDDERRVIPEPWGVEGIAEHPGLIAVIEAAGANGAAGDDS